MKMSTSQGNLAKNNEWDKFENNIADYIIDIKNVGEV